MAFIMQIISGEWVEIPQIMSSGESSKSGEHLTMLFTNNCILNIFRFNNVHFDDDLYNN